MQGMGWLTTEELVFDTQGRLLTHAPSTYKIPVASDVPEDFRVALYPNANPQDTIYRSKAVGEPPIMLANSVFCALADAVHAIDPSQARAARCAGDAGGDPARLRGLARAADAATERRVKTWRQLAEFLAAHGAAALIGVHDVKGSAPREAGARMVVRPDGAFHGTIGGGQLEMKMLEHRPRDAGRGRGRGPPGRSGAGSRSRPMLRRPREDPHRDLRYARSGTGQALRGAGGQRACSFSNAGWRMGVVQREIASSVGDDRWTQWRETHGENRTPVLLFGAGHVGRALGAGAGASALYGAMVRQPPGCLSRPYSRRMRRQFCMNDSEAEIAAAAPDAFVLVMTHDHPLDLAITAAALSRGFPYVGLIGSASKRARFEKRFREIGLAAGSHRRARLPHRSCRASPTRTRRSSPPP